MEGFAPRDPLPEFVGLLVNAECGAEKAQKDLKSSK
jgi:hypothetical protein